MYIHREVYPSHGCFAFAIAPILSKSNNLLVHVDWFWWIQDNSGGFEIKGFGVNMHISIVLL